MSVKCLIESVGLSGEELRQYLLSEIDEFLAAADPAAMEEEFGDALFALACMAWAHSGRHFRLGLDAAEAKLRGRLRNYGTITAAPENTLMDGLPRWRSAWCTSRWASSAAIGTSLTPSATEPPLR
jgi:hypothetical protein